VAIGPGTTTYRAAGEFLRNGTPVDAPRVSVSFETPFHIMKYPVSTGEYARCVAEDACAPADQFADQEGGYPVTGVSFEDAQMYAAWLSRKTGLAWRLPSDEEWVYAAGSRFYDDAVGFGVEANDPAKRWIAEYQRKSELTADLDGKPRPLGSYGENEYGLWDLSGNVWEWTSTCYARARVTESGTTAGERAEHCGVRVVEGRHRAYVIFFVKDAKGGGCMVGIPPLNLGFRLVHDGARRLDFTVLETWWHTLAQ
jgi:formylglycine-generating enzyme required for sulfatase activity